MKQNPFSDRIPETYFDTFGDRVLDKVRTYEKKRSGLIWVSRLQWPVAAMLIIGTALFFRPNTKPTPPGIDFSSVERADWTTLLETAEFSNEELTELLSNETIDSMLSFGVSYEPGASDAVLIQDELSLEFDPVESPLGSTADYQ